MGSRNPELKILSFGGAKHRPLDLAAVLVAVRAVRKPLTYLELSWRLRFLALRSRAAVASVG